MWIWQSEISLPIWKLAHINIQARWRCNAVMGNAWWARRFPKTSPGWPPRPPLPANQSHEEGPGGRTLQDSRGWGKASQPTYPPMLKRSPKEPDDKVIWNFITDPWWPKSNLLFADRLPLLTAMERQHSITAANADHKPDFLGTSLSWLSISLPQFSHL